MQRRVGRQDGFGPVNFDVQGGALPYEPAGPKRLMVLGEPGAIGVIEDGFACELSLDECDFRMDTYGREPRRHDQVTKGLEERL